MALVVVIGLLAPPTREIQCLIVTLHDNYNRLKSLHNFQYRISNEVIYQLCHHLERYFSTYCTTTAVTARDFPTFDIDFLIQGIANNNLASSFTTGPIFLTHTQQYRRQQQISTGCRNSTNKATTRKCDQQPQPTAKGPRFTKQTGPGCDKIKKAISNYKTKNGRSLRLSDVCTANDFTTNKEMCTAIGSGACTACVLPQIANTSTKTPSHPANWNVPSPSL
jgi:hypothetical protein